MDSIPFIRNTLDGVAVLYYIIIIYPLGSLPDSESAVSETVTQIKIPVELYPVPAKFTGWPKFNYI